MSHHEPPITITITLAGTVLRSLDYTAACRDQSRTDYLRNKIVNAFDEGRSTIVLDRAPDDYVVRRREREDKPVATADEQAGLPGEVPLFTEAGTPVPVSVPTGATPIVDEIP